RATNEMARYLILLEGVGNAEAGGQRASPCQIPARLYFWVYARSWPLAFPKVDRGLHRKLPAVRQILVRVASEVRRNHYVLELQQRVAPIRGFLLQHVQPCASDLSGL